MPTVRQMYFNGSFRWEPDEETLETVGDAETWSFVTSADGYEAFQAACSLDIEWSNDAEHWFEHIIDAGLLVAVEQCCYQGELLPGELRALRLKRFSRSDQMQTEAVIRCLPDQAIAAVKLIYWWVRIERAKRTGSSDFDPSRSRVINWSSC